jgi:3'-phosphoadenosine 5'-phosphosulfate sulfotransferase (PAPS reductase)/FAD synthetase
MNGERKKATYHVCDLKNDWTFLDKEEAIFFGRKWNLPVFTIDCIQQPLIVGEAQKKRNEIYDLQLKIKHLKKEIKELSPDTVDFPFTDPSFKNKEQWSSKKYAYREFKRKKEIFK